MNTDPPRLFQRLQALGVPLFVAGLTTQTGHYHFLSVAGILLTVVLLVRLSIEFSIGEKEPEQSLVRRLKRPSLLNQFSMLTAMFGIVGYSFPVRVAQPWPPPALPQLFTDVLDKTLLRTITSYNGV